MLLKVLLILFSSLRVTVFPLRLLNYTLMFYSPFFRVFLPLLILVLGHAIASAQAPVATGADSFTIRGSVLDAADKMPVEFATVVLTLDGKVISTAATDSSGGFRIAAAQQGSYKLSVSFLGYTSYETALTLPGTPGTLPILLHSQASALEGVIIQGKRALIRASGDKLVYNAGADISNKAGSASDVLRKVPMLTVGADGEVKLRGSANIKVLLNGMPSGMFAKNLKDALKLIPASTIESVEVITSPSSKYEAEGAAGVINIITRKRLRGTSGEVNVSAGNLEQSAGIALNLVRGKFDFTLNLNATNERERRTSELARTTIADGLPNGELLQLSAVTRHDRGGSGELGIAFRPDSTQRIGMGFTLWKGSWPSASTLYNRYRDGRGSVEYNQESKEAGKYSYYELSMNYQKKFRRKGRELQLSGTLGWLNDFTEYTTNQYTLSGWNYFRETGPNKSSNRDINLQADYVHPLDRSGKSILETGLRFSRSSSGSVYTVRNNEGAPGSTDMKEAPARSDKLDYIQNIYAAYVSIKLETITRWTFRAGLRYEGTGMGSVSRTAAAPYRTAFGNLVPSLLLSKRLNDRHELLLTYTERIRRPWIWDLNPFVNASDPRNLTFGNPLLKPERTRIVEAGHHYTAESGFSLNSSIYYSFNSNAIESLTSVDSLGISRTSPRNIAANRRLGASINAGMEIGNNIAVNGGLELYQVWFKSEALNVNNNAFFYSGQLNLSYTLPKGFTLQASGDYNNGYVTLQGRNSAVWSYSLAAQKELFDKKLSILVGVSNPFQNSMLQRSRAAAPSFRSTERSHYYNRAFHITLSWNFGAMLSSSKSDEKKVRPVERH